MKRNKPLYIYAVYWTPWDSRRKQPYGRTVRSYVIATDDNDAQEVLMAKGAYIDGVERGEPIHYLSEDTCRSVLRARAADWIENGESIKEILNVRTETEEQLSNIDFDF